MDLLLHYRIFVPTLEYLPSVGKVADSQAVFSKYIRKNEECEKISKQKRIKIKKSEGIL